MALWPAVHFVTIWKKPVGIFMVLDFELGSCPELEIAD